MMIFIYSPSMSELSTPEPARHASPTAKAIELTHLVLERPDLQRAEAFLRDFGLLPAERSDDVLYLRAHNGSAYCSHAWRDTCADLEITHKRTQPYRPQTNGKLERFHRTLADGWAYARFYDSESQRRAALPSWLHYNHHRAHSAIGGKPPVTRLTNLPGHHT